MFRRVITESWHEWAPYAAFAITFTVFIAAFVRALLMKKDRAEDFARLPLDDGEPIQKPESLKR